MNKQEVIRLSEKIAFELRQQYVGRNMMVLTETDMNAAGNRISGHTENFLNVIIEGKGMQQNQLIEVELGENTPEGLLGKVIEPLSQKICCG